VNGTNANLNRNYSAILASLQLFDDYADDNTVSYCDYDLNKVVNTLEADSLKLINWFSINLMKANPDKFQAGAFKYLPIHLKIFGCLDAFFFFFFFTIFIYMFFKF
jgi:hypothetical protein